MPAAIFNRVDLPEPLRPTRHSRSPGRDGNIGTLQGGRAAEGQVDVAQKQKRRSHAGL